MRISDWSSDVCSSDLFDTVDQLHAQRYRRAAGLFQTFEGVMIGQGQDSHAFLERTRNQYRGRQGAIGGRAMAVQINIHRRSEERRVGKECVSTCRSRWAAEHEKKKKQNKKTKK